MIGKRIGRLTVLARTGRSILVRCDCGAEKIIEWSNLRRTKSCGCLARESIAERNRASARHGHAARRSPEYSSWTAMLARCTNPRAPNFAKYGGRGITMCDQWRSFDAFLADMGVRPAGTSLDRIDGTRGYEPGNCRWATAKEQRANRCR